MMPPFLGFGWGHGRVAPPPLDPLVCQDKVIAHAFLFVPMRQISANLGPHQYKTGILLVKLCQC